MTYYEVRLDGIPEPVTISMKNLAGRRGTERGMRVRVGWDPEALVVFSD
jgi:spermidine/putrescine transport system ATP-binding protein